MGLATSRRPARRHLANATVGAFAAVLAACGPSSTDAPADEVVVLAASSLSGAMEALAAEFMASPAGGDVQVVLDLAGSQTLAMRIVEGAPADLFVAADTTQLDVVARAGLLTVAPVTIATNTLAIVVEAGNPLGVRGLADLARDDLVVVLPAQEVPAGRYAAEVLTRAGVPVSPASLERSVRGALAKVVQGEADAAIVFASDVHAALRGGSSVEGVPIPAEQNVVATYPMAPIAGGAATEAFAALVRSERGREVLVDHGFGVP